MKYTKEEVSKLWHIGIEELEGFEIIFHKQKDQDYSGKALTILQKDDQLFANYGSHCSCDGFEDQWDPEQTTLIELKNQNDDLIHEALKELGAKEQ